MRAALTKDSTMVVTEVPDPVPQEGQLLVRTLACGICGSDLHALSDPDAFMETTRRAGGTPYDPRDGLVFGHEFSAEIVEHGPGTQGTLPVGTVVCGPPIAFGPQGAGIVGYAPMYPGGYGEYMILNEGFVMAVPNGLDPGVAAITEPFAVATRAVARSGIGADDVAVVLGLGPIGLGVVAALKARGHGPVIAADFSPKRRSLAEGLGADELIDPAQASPYSRWADLGVPVTTVERVVGELLGTRGRGAVIFECVGVPGVLGAAIEGAPAGSTIMLVGVCMQTDEVMPGVAAGKELTIRGTFGAMPDEYGATLHAIADGRIDAGSIITGTVGLEGVAGAFRDLADPEAHAKIVVVPG
ncbi:zinc-binding dehydrogenase [Thermomonospora umbrina]|uniref:Threonine dehydrogenase-like Zn-dependent dehydrogenase n=1 Tax=Thermomonospora umbrina TaxID=111806 RepID=A0A3D9STS0_9ACTN|nr:zinc-binding dehydrogenase [Thermomonospora umbrina]REE99188.1 threonine dehydrogenase-like Zn-dependent dehydrogenase [Thermomonospora umbrina]